MIGSGLKKLAKEHNMQIASGVAYGSLMGYATTLSEGSGWKRIDIATSIANPEQLRAELSAVNLQKEYRVQALSIEEKFIAVIFTDNPGTMNKIQAFIQWFYPLLQQHGATGANICAECGQPITGNSWYLLRNTVFPLHDTCAEKIRNEQQEDLRQQQEEDTGSYIQGFLGALVGSALGAVVWAIVLYLGYVASLVGLLIGWLANKGYDLLHGRQGKGKVVILILAVVLGVVLGTIIPDVVILGEMLNAGELPGLSFADIPSIILETFANDAEYRGAVISNMAMGLLFAGLGAFALIKRTSDQVSTPKMKKLR